MLYVYLYRFCFVLLFYLFWLFVWVFVCLFVCLFVCVVFFWFLFFIFCFVFLFFLVTYLILHKKNLMTRNVFWIALIVNTPESNDYQAISKLKWNNYHFLVFERKWVLNTNMTCAFIYPFAWFTVFCIQM